MRRSRVVLVSARALLASLSVALVASACASSPVTGSGPVAGGASSSAPQTGVSSAGATPQHPGSMPPASSADDRPAATPHTPSEGSRPPSGSVSGAASVPPSLSTAVIPWRDDPATLVYPPDPDRPMTQPVRYRPCTAVDLKASTQGWGVGMGTATQRLTLTDVGGTPCSLAGQPVSFVDRLRDGTTLDVPVAAVAPDAGYGRGLDAVANLSPGESAFADVWVSDSCTGFQQARAATSFAIELADRSRVSVSERVGVSAPPAGCDVGASWFGTPHVHVPETVYPVDPLKVTLNLPTAVRAGSTFDYTVTLTNPTAAAVPLTPCPTYQEAWKPVRVATALSRVYRLNCDGHTEVGPLQALTFAMRMVAPAVPIEDVFSWTIHPSSAVGANAMLAVTD